MWTAEYLQIRVSSICVGTLEKRKMVVYAWPVDDIPLIFEGWALGFYRPLGFCLCVLSCDSIITRS